jgi:hypothetical protein
MSDEMGSSGSRRARFDTLYYWLCLVLAVALFVPLSYGSFDVATGHSQHGGLDGVGVVFLLMPPTQVAFVVGGWITALIAGRPRLALQWCVYSLTCFVFIDFLMAVLYVYAYGIV